MDPEAMAQSSAVLVSTRLKNRGVGIGGGGTGECESNCGNGTSFPADQILNTVVRRKHSGNGIKLRHRPELLVASLKHRIQRRAPKFGQMKL